GLGRCAGLLCTALLRLFRLFGPSTGHSASARSSLPDKLLLAAEGDRDHGFLSALAYHVDACHRAVSLHSAVRFRRTPGAEPQMDQATNEGGRPMAAAVAQFRSNCSLARRAS